MLRTLDAHKASRPDGMPAHLLKETCEEIAPSLTLASMQQCTLPIDQKEANVPSFKKGDRSIASNYRPVSLTSICSILLEHIVY